MEQYNIQIIETLAVLVSFFLIRFTITKTIEKVASKFSYQKPRVKMIKKIINLFITIGALGILLLIWGVDQSEFIYYISTVLTILGIAFFATLSFKSSIACWCASAYRDANIHSNCPGFTFAIKSIGYTATTLPALVFFVILKIQEFERITLPGIIFIQKMIKKKDHS